MPNLISRHDYSHDHRPANKGAPRVPVYTTIELAAYFGLTKGRFQRLLSTRSGPTPALVVRNRNDTADKTYYNRLEVASWLASIGEWRPDQESNYE